jgi:hypothetical protein
MVGRSGRANSPAEGAISADHGGRMKLVGRRALLLAALALPVVGAEPALAAKMPLKPKSERSRPLGVWGLVDRLPTADVGGAVSVNLSFRPAIDIEAPVMRWWVPRWTQVATSQGRLCAPPTLSNQLVLEPMVAGAYVPIHLDIPVPVPPEPYNAITRGRRSTLPTSRRKRLYRASIDLVDPESCRRAGFSFVFAVMDEYP